jgi:hypothetical protein
MDILAGELGMDPVELRRLNALDVGSVTCTGQTMRESVGLNECIERIDADMRAGDFQCWTTMTNRAPRYGYLPPNWGRACLPCWRPAPPRNWACRATASACCSAIPTSARMAGRPRPVPGWRADHGQPPDLCQR